MTHFTHQYTDMTHFTLHCLVCGTLLKEHNEAHARPCMPPQKNILTLRKYRSAPSSLWWTNLWQHNSWLLITHGVDKKYSYKNTRWFQNKILSQRINPKRIQCCNLLINIVTRWEVVQERCLRWKMFNFEIRRESEFLRDETTDEKCSILANHKKSSRIIDLRSIKFRRFRNFQTRC